MSEEILMGSFVMVSLGLFTLCVIWEIVSDYREQRH